MNWVTTLVSPPSLDYNPPSLDERMLDDGTQAEALSQFIFQNTKRLLGRIDKANQFQILAADGSGLQQPTEVESALPKLRAVKEDVHAMPHLVGLDQSEELKHFVHGSKTTGKDDQRLGGLREPKLAHEEVAEQHETGR